jgi:hypothetical protein
MKKNKMKEMAVFGGFVNRAEATNYGMGLPEEIVLINIRAGAFGMPVTPLCYFPITRSLLQNILEELNRVPKDDDDDTPY